MFNKKPVQLVQLGALQEQAVLLKTSNLFDGIVIKANLVENFPAATYSFLQKFSKKYFIDPITYVFGVDPKNLYVGDDIPKQVYLELGNRYLQKFYQNLNNGKATNEKELLSSDIEELSRNTIRFQEERLNAVIESGDFFQRLLDEIKPVNSAFYIAPYFVICPENFDYCVKINISLLENSLKIKENTAAIIPITYALLKSKDSLIKLAKQYNSTGCKIFIFWVDNMNEINLSKNEIINLISFIQELKKVGTVINLYGGYLSALLTKIGLDGFSHGPGYSERRPFSPVQGMLPTPMYYFLPFHQRYKVDNFFDMFRKITKERFKSKVCSCPICDRLINTEASIVAAMSPFLEIQKRIPYKVRTVSGKLTTRVKIIYTNRSHQLARFHYIINKNREFSEVRKNNWAELKAKLRDDREFFESLRQDITPIDNWLNLISSIEEK